MSKQALKVLVLEDSGTQARVITAMLSACGAVTTHAISGKEFESKLCDASHHFDAVLIDIQFGDVCGLDLIPEVHKRWPDTAIAMMTANKLDNFSVLSKARELGANFVLAKPFTKSTIRFLLSDIRSLRETGASRKHVIVIDDSPTSCKIAGTLLADAGYRVSMFTDALEAISQLSYDWVDVVLTDMNMPGMGGAELINLVRDVWEEVAIVAMSADKYDAEMIGADIFLLKPFAPKELVEALGTALEKPSGKRHDMEMAIELDC